MKPQLEIALKRDESGVVEYPVKAAVFGNITALSLFFVSSICCYCCLAENSLLVERL